MTTRARTEATSADTPRANGTPPAVGASGRRRLLVATVPPAWRFPLLVLLAVVVLGSLKLSGSSASLYARKDHGGVVVGRARDLRTDEWWVRTPLLARQEALGLPDRDEIGVGDHDMAVISDLPTRGWETFVRPHTVPYHVLGIERAFAFEWWLAFLALPALGVYAFALKLGTRVVTAALVSMIVVLSPFVQWWTGSWTGTIGYATLCAAALIGATQAKRLYASVALAVLAGWLGACLVVVLYPSTVIPTAFFVAAAAAGVIASSYPAHGPRREWWLRLLVVLGVVAAVGGALVLSFFLAHRGALDAIADTVYPGRGRAAGGTGDLAVLFGAPFDVIESTRSAVTVSVNGINQSEASAGLFTIFAVIAVVVVDRLRLPARPWRTRVVLYAILGASLLLLAWYALPIPEALGRLVLFDRVRPDRLLLPLAVASALALGLSFDQRRASRSRSMAAVAVGTAAFAVPTLWAGARLRIDGELASRWQMLLLAGAFTLGVGLALRGSRAGLWLLVALLAVSAAVINPLQHGLTALVESPSAQLGRALRSRPDTGAVLNFWGGRLEARGGLTASGVPLVSGVNLYPSEAAWRILDPNDSDREAWDSYNNAVWSPAPPGSRPQIQGHADMVTVAVDPCDPRLNKLGVRTIVSVQPLTDPCLAETDRVAGEAGTTLYAYRINRD